MRSIFLAMCVGVSLYPTTGAKEQPPRFLIQAAQCLAAKEFLPPSSAPSLSLGYVVDEKSYPGDRVLYVVDYASRGRTHGFVFAIFLTEKNHLQIFNIQNNAKFVRSKGRVDGIDFVEPPLGGIWTQEHLVSAIKQIELRPAFRVSAGDLTKAVASTKCESYTDNK
jgi:hypothetical protein